MSYYAGLLGGAAGLGGSRPDAFNDLRNRLLSDVYVPRSSSARYVGFDLASGEITKEPKSIREELQSEIDNWLEGVW